MKSMKRMFLLAGCIWLAILGAIMAYAQININICFIPAALSGIMLRVFFHYQDKEMLNKINSVLSEDNE